MFDCMLSTFDNPFNPFEQFIPWFMFDTEKGYNCCSRLARIAQIGEDFTDTYIKVRNKNTNNAEISDT